MNDTAKTDRASTGLSGRNLDAALKKAGVSKYRLAKDLNISYRIVQYWAKGRRPSPAMAERVAAYLGIQSGHVGMDEKSLEAFIVQTVKNAVADGRLEIKIFGKEGGE